jgi:hypothetical protein
MRERRARYAAEPRQVEEILQEGTRHMRREAQETMSLVHQAMGLVRDLKV